MPSHFDEPMPFKPRYYWDEKAGLKDDAPMYVKLIYTHSQRQTMPGKAASVFGVTVGYTHPVHMTGHHVFWRVIPADIELRESEIIFVPVSKHGLVKPVAPKSEQVQADEPKPDKAKHTKPTPAETSEGEKLDRTKPTYQVTYLRLLHEGKGRRAAIPVGVTFPTHHNNHRLVWDMMPTSEELAIGALILNPIEDEEDDESQASRSWWHLPIRGL